MAMNTYAPCYRIVVNGTELRHGVSVDVLSVSVTETLNQADSFTFTVRDRHPERGRLFAGGDTLKWLDSDVFDEGNEVEIHLGYVDNLQLLIRGEVTAVSPSFPTSGQPTLTVQGYSLYHRLQRQRRRQPFESATDSGIAREIARELNLTPQVDETQAEHPLVSPTGETYAELLRQRAERIGFEVAVKDRTLYFQRPRYLDNPSPAVTLEWGRSLISFSPRLSTYNAVTEVTVRGPQTSTGRGKEPLVGTARTGDERVRLGSETGPEISQRRFGDSQVLLRDHNVASAEEANEVARAHLEGRGMDFMTGRGSCIGNPDLRARSIIELKGLGRKFSGRYYVTSTTHAVGGSGYQTDFEVRRNAR
jgi:phage protein D